MTSQALKSADAHDGCVQIITQGEKDPRKEGDMHVQHELKDEPDNTRNYLVDNPKRAKGNHNIEPMFMSGNGEARVGDLGRQEWDPVRLSMGTDKCCKRRSCPPHIRNIGTVDLATESMSRAQKRV